VQSRRIIKAASLAAVLAVVLVAVQAALVSAAVVLDDHMVACETYDSCVT
jgi:hypothetical protein